MLRLWPDFSSQKIWLAISVDGIAIVKQTRGLHKRILSQRYIKASGADAAGWQTLINQLDEYLSGSDIKQNTQINIVLSSDFVRYLMLPAQQITMSKAEKISYAHAVFTEIYGAMVSDWHIKYHQAAPHQSTVAVAVDNALLAALNQLAVKHQFKLNSVQPYLMTAFNALARPIASTSGHLVLLENKKLLLVHLHKGTCQQMQVTPYSHDWQTDLNNMLNREVLLNERLDAMDKTLLIYAPTEKNISLNPLSGWKTQRIGYDKNPKLAPQFYMLEAVL